MASFARPGGQGPLDVNVALGLLGMVDIYGLVCLVGLVREEHEK